MPPRRGRLILGTDLGPEWNNAVRGLFLADKKIPRDVNDTLHVAAIRGAGAAAAKALTIPVHGKKHRGTRVLVARGVHVNRTPLGWRVGTSMPPGMEILPRGFTSQFFHPVFGRGRVVQHTHYDWFAGPISDQYDYIIRRINRDLDDTANMIDNMAGG